MPYIPPTASAFQARYPEFDNVSADLVTLVLAEAQAEIGPPETTRWLERDAAPAIMLLTAHRLITEGAVERSAPGGDGSSSMTTTGPIVQATVGEVTVRYAGSSSFAGGSGGAGGLAADYGATEYGRRFLRLLRLNFTGPMVA